MAKVHEEAKLKPAGFQVIENLSAMLISEFGDSLEFEDYFLVADKIRKIFSAESRISSDNPSLASFGVFGGSSKILRPDHTN